MPETLRDIRTGSDMKIRGDALPGITGRYCTGQKSFGSFSEMPAFLFDTENIMTHNTPDHDLKQDTGSIGPVGFLHEISCTALFWLTYLFSSVI